MIAHLEEELGVNLFNRKQRHIYLNEFGREYLHHVDIALRAIENGRTLRQNMSDQYNRKISVAMAISTGTSCSL